MAGNKCDTELSSNSLKKRCKEYLHPILRHLLNEKLKTMVLSSRLKAKKAKYLNTASTYFANT
ncbi:MAG: hypothetical protein AYK18_17790 [Theionarchaea archaeon DG-70]|nr:MAG: hypothetical protein AYK18_17790 [Theionarchaea archaeon DG-70]